MKQALKKCLAYGSLFCYVFFKWTIGTVTVTLLVAVPMLYCQHGVYFALVLAIPVPSISGEPPPIEN